jgi:hypothetical protein
MKIAISGKTCSGKDTLARAIGFTPIALADSLKDEVINNLKALGFNITREELDRDKARFRDYLQAHGTLSKSNELINNVAITDVRLINEVVELEKAGFLIIRLECAESVREERYFKLYGKELTEQQKSHISEVELDDYPFNWIIRSDIDLSVEAEVVKGILGYMEQIDVNF